MLPIGLLVVATLAVVGHHPASMVAAAFVGVPVRDLMMDAQPDVNRGAFNVQLQLLNGNAADLGELELLDKQTVANGEAGYNITYTLGSRVSGDKLVAQDVLCRKWPTPQSVNINVNYPTDGPGAEITCVVAHIGQSSEEGRAYVVQGGLHQRFIQLVVEADNTLYVNAVDQIYGV